MTEQHVNAGDLKRSRSHNVAREPLFHMHSITATLNGEGCEVCLGEGLVCENHPKRAWNSLPDGCTCGAGMPCPRCESPVIGCLACEADRA